MYLCDPLWRSSKRYFGGSEKNAEDKTICVQTPLPLFTIWITRKYFEVSWVPSYETVESEIYSISRVTVTIKTDEDVFWNVKNVPNIKFHLHRENRINISIHRMGSHSLVNLFSWCFYFLSKSQKELHLIQQSTPQHRAEEFSQIKSVGDIWFRLNFTVLWSKRRTLLEHC